MAIVEQIQALIEANNGKIGIQIGTQLDAIDHKLETARAEASSAFLLKMPAAVASSALGCDDCVGGVRRQLRLAAR